MPSGIVVSARVRNCRTQLDPQPSLDLPGPTRPGGHTSQEGTLIVPDSSMSAYLSLVAAASYLDCNERTIRRRIADGSLPASRIRGGRDIKIRRADLDALLAPIRAAG